MASRTRYTVSGYQAPTAPAPAPTAPVNPDWYKNPALRFEVDQVTNQFDISKAEIPFDPRVTTYVGPTREQTLALQTLLRSNGYRIAADGIFGPQTVNALRDFQARRAAQQQTLATDIAGKREQQLAGMQSQADAARKKLLDLSGQIAKERSRQARLTATNLRRLATEDFDNDFVISQVRDIERRQQQAERQAREEAESKKPKGLKKFALGALDKLNYASSAVFSGFKESADLLGSTLDVGRTKDEHFSFQDFKRQVNERKGFGQYLDSGNRAVDIGLGAFGELAADPLNLLGGAATKPFRAVGTRAADAAVRTAAREAGLSLGARLSTRAATRELGNIAPVVRQEARRELIESSRLGRDLLDRAVKAAVDNQSEAALRKVVKGLESVAARDVLKAGREGGEALARQKLVDAFAKELWQPNIKLTRQAGARVGLAGSGLVGGVGRGALTQSGAALVRRAARGGGEGLATATTRRSGQAIAHALDSAAARSGAFLPDLSTTLRAGFSGDLIDRLNQVWDIAKGSDVPAFTDAVSEQLGEIGRTLGRHAEDLNNAPADVLQQAEALAARLEDAAGVLDGRAGEAARAQFTAEMQQGFLPVASDRAARLVADATKNVGLRLPQTTSKFGKQSLKNLNEAIDELLIPDELKARLKADAATVEKAKGKGFRTLASSVEALRARPEIRDEALRLFDNAPERAAQLLPDVVGTGGTPLVRQAARLGLSLVESTPPAAVPFAAASTTTRQVAGRAEALDRWALSLQLDDPFRQQLARAAEEVLTEDGLYRIVRDVLHQYGARHGLDGDDLERIRDLFDNGLKEAKSESRKTQAFLARSKDDIVRDQVQVLSQRIERIPLPDPSEVRNYVDGVLARRGNAAAKLRLRARGVSEGHIANLLRKGHSAWKFSIVTNIHMPVIGALGGFIGSDGDLGDRFKAAAIGAAIGMVGPVRYVARVPLIEERILRYYMARGFRAPEWIPSVSKWYRRSGVDLPFLSHDAVAGTHVLSRHLSGANRLLSVNEEGWVALGRKQHRFLDAWKRIVNWQIHPETDEVARLMLNEKAGFMTAEQVGDAVKQFLKTDDGKIFLKRFRGSLGNAGSKADDVIESYRSFVDHHIPSMDLAKLRLQAAEDGTDLAVDLLKSSLKAGIAPDVIHAQKSWIIPRNARQVILARNNFFQKFVLAGPTTRLSREPMAEWIYREEYKRLLRAGNSPQVAQEVADDLAVRRTNEIMFRIDDETRFAKKIDFFAPFQQPREELLRVWGKLALRHPGRTLKTARLAALGFNQAEDKGIFKRDIHGEWVMSVPGSAALSRALFGVSARMDASLKGMLFFGQGAYGVGILPSPGGPWFATASRKWAEANPDTYKDMNPVLKQLLFPYGAQGELIRNEPNRLWMALTGDTPPWEFASKADQERELERWQKEVWLQLYADHVRKTGDTDYVPSIEEVKKATRDLFKVWAFTGSVFPSAPHPVLPSMEDFNLAKEAYTNTATGKFMYEEFIQDNPQFEPFLRRRTEYVGPDDLKHWKESDEVKWDDYIVKFRRHLTVEEFARDWRQYKDEQKAYAEREQIYKEPNRWERERKLIDWRLENPDLAERAKNSYHRDRDLWTILHTYPTSQREVAVDRWRKEYDVSYRQFKSLSEKVRTFKFSAWSEARQTEEVIADVSKQVRLGISEAAYVAMLQPAEQIRYWNWKIGEMSYEQGSDDPQATLDRYHQYRRNLSDLWKANPNLLSERVDTPYEKMVNAWRGDVSRQIGAMYDEVGLLKPAMDAAAQAKDWKNYYALRGKRDALYDAIKLMKNRAYRSFPDLANLEADVQAMLVFASQGDAAKLAKVIGTDVDLFVSSNEEAHFLSMPDEVKQAFVQDLVAALDTESGQKGKLFWTWLTDFQRDLLESNLPEDMVGEWKAEEPGSSPNAKGSGLSGSFFEGHNTFGDGAGELAFALEMFKQYSKRGDRAAPKAYEAYLALPNNPAVKSQFLKSHPEVGEWIRLGPMANMPQLYRMIVTNIMVKYGRWEGEPRDVNEITDIAFAREQLDRWNRRTGSRPATYDAWINMPTGVAKAQYLQAHPEVQDWIRMGPMANMPEEYREVVRDIMLRYGEWTERQDDPLGKTISEYYATPKYAREDFLKAHPELLAYWSLTRDPKEQAMFDLSDRYFALPDPMARKLFLSAHPELQDWFVERRTKRYEKFLNKVAQFMGQNPALFESYLQRQEDILAELLQKYAEAPLVREVPRTPTVSTGRTRRGSTEGGRQRNAA